MTRDALILFAFLTIITIVLGLNVLVDMAILRGC